MIFYADLIQIRRFASKRQDMKVGQRKEIRAVKMFFPVVVVLFLCNIIPYIHYGLIRSGVIYRELQMSMYASFALNSAANLPIYYYKGPGFKNETRAVLMQMLPFTKSWFASKEQTESSKNTSTTGTRKNSET